MGIFSSNNMIINVSNIICFITIQTLFFYFIASKQFNKLLIDKTEIVSSYISHDPDLRAHANQYFHGEEWKDITNTGKQQTKLRTKANVSLINRKIVPLVLVAVCILGCFVYKLTHNNEPWSRIDTILLTLVLGAFTTEFLFFIGIVSQYQHYGDHAIYYKLLKTIRDNLVVSQ